MRRTSQRLLAALVLLAACGDKDDATTMNSAPTAPASESGTTGESGPLTSSDSAATEGGSLTAPQTTANSVTTPPETDSTTATTMTTDGQTVTSANPTMASASGGDPDEDATQLCVDTINMYRASIGLPPYQRWTDAEDCSDGEARSDGESDTPHGAFGACGESAQNECPGWPGPPAEMIPGCLAQMWAEGPGDDFNMHGHYINMSSTDYTMVACGFAEVNGEIWAVQNFK